MLKVHQPIVPVDSSMPTAQLVNYTRYMGENLPATRYCVHAAKINQPHDMPIGSSILSDTDWRYSNLWQ